MRDQTLRWAILNRSAFLSLILAAAVGLVFAQTYSLWEKGPWELPGSSQGENVPGENESVRDDSKPRPPGTQNIVTKDLFDPNRGALSGERGEAVNAPTERVQDLILLGTAIIGDGRYAILQEPAGRPATVRGAPLRPGGLLRLKLGDSVDGYELAEIHEKKVIFVKDDAKVEIELDYFRKVQEPRDQKRPTAPTRVPQPNRLPSVPRQRTSSSVVTQ